MAITKYFTDNTTYGADDMNAAFSHLISEGVTCFDTENALTDSTQQAVASIASSGVGTGTASGCAVVCENGVYKVSEGVCFLADGTHIAVDENGEEITVTPNAVNYVYVRHDTIDNDIDIVVSATAGGAGTVPLATVAADGTVTDTRQFAYCKIRIGATAANAYTQRTVQTTYAGDEKLIDSFRVPHGFKYVLALCNDSSDPWYEVLPFTDGETSKSFRLTGKSLPKIMTVDISDGVVKVYLGGSIGVSSVTLIFV